MGFKVVAGEVRVRSKSLLEILFTINSLKYDESLSSSIIPYEGI